MIVLIQASATHPARDSSEIGGHEQHLLTASLHGDLNQTITAYHFFMDTDRRTTRDLGFQCEN